MKSTRTTLSKKELKEWKDKYAGMLTDFKQKDLIDIILDDVTDDTIIEFRQETLDWQCTDDMLDTLHTLYPVVNKK